MTSSPFDRFLVKRIVVLLSLVQVKEPTIPKLPVQVTEADVDM